MTPIKTISLTITITTAITTAIALLAITATTATAAENPVLVNSKGEAGTFHEGVRLTV
jgi:hypothetical protein